VPLDNGWVTGMYAPLQRKTQQAYTEMLHMVAEACTRNRHRAPQPRNIHCDFETAVHQALKTVMPLSTIRGCFYHLCQISYAISVFDKEQQSLQVTVDCIGFFVTHFCSIHACSKCYKAAAPIVILYK